MKPGVTLTMIIGLSGGLGSGKTLTTTFLMIMFKREFDMEIVTNYSTDVTDVKVSNPVELNEVSRERTGAQGLDELWSWADSRKSSENDVMTELVVNSRKRGWVIVYNAQKFHMVDKRLRDNTDYYGICEHVKGADNDVARVQFLDKDMNMSGSMSYDPSPFYDMYDTREEVSQKSLSEMYDEYLNMAQEMIENDEIEYKKELISYLVMQHDVPKTRADMIATEAMRVSGES